MIHILEGYISDADAAKEMGYTPRTVAAIRARPDGGPPYIVVRRQKHSTREDWRKYWENQARRANPRRSTRRQSKSIEQPAA